MKGWTIFGVGFALYFVSIFGSLVQDDMKVIGGDPDMGKLSSLASVWLRPYYWREKETSVYRPVTSFSFYLNSLVTGKEAWGFRLGNVLIYAGVCWLVFEVLKKVKVKRAFWWAVVFAVLPIHTEVVNNIVGRAEMLSLGFLLMSMGKCLDRKWENGVWFLFLALLSKETAAVGLPILGYLITSDKKIGNKERWGAGILVLMTLGGFMLWRAVVLGGWGWENRATLVENPLKFLPREKRIINAMGLIPFGVSKIVFPLNMSYDYSFNQLKLVKNWYDGKVIFGLLMIMLSLMSFWRKDLKKDRLWWVGMMLFWGPVLITGNILFPIGTIFGERLWFLPSLGLVMMLAVGVNRLDKLQSRFFRLILAVILLVYSGRTIIRNLDWLSQEKLFLHDSEYVTGSVLAKNNKAAMLLMKNDLERAKKTLEEADKIYPKYPELLNNWGLYYWWTGRSEEARKKFEECLVERPGNELCQKNLNLVD